MNSLAEIKTRIMRVIESNDELKSLIKNGNIVLDCDIHCDFDIDVSANIKARDIKALNIKALNINAWDINARDIDAQDIKARDIDALDINALNINARDIDARDIDAQNIKAGDIAYYAVCTSYEVLECKSIRGRRMNSIHKCLDRDIKIKKEESSTVIINGKEIELSPESYKALKDSLCN